jgi:hypothetical protein
MAVSSFSEVASLTASGVVDVSHTSRAFAALKTDGSVVVWGDAHYGGSVSSAVAALLTSGVKLVCANEVAFTAIKMDGSVITWGHQVSVGSGGVVAMNSGGSSIVSCEVVSL